MHSRIYRSRHRRRKIGRSKDLFEKCSSFTACGLTGGRTLYVLRVFGEHEGAAPERSAWAIARC